MSPDIILYAIIAVVLLARLWSMFGQRNDTDQQRPNPFASPAPKPLDGVDARYTPSEGSPPVLAGVAPKAAPSRVFILPPASLDGGLAQVQKLYPNFDEKEFLQSARATFTLVVADFAKGDMTRIVTSLGPKVLPQFTNAIQTRKDAGQTLDCHIHAITEAEIISARTEETKAFLTVRFVSSQAITLKDSNGSIIAGGPDAYESVTDIWVFMRENSLSDANWILVETKS